MADSRIKSEELATYRKTGDSTFDIKKDDTTNGRSYDLLKPVGNRLKYVL